MIRPGMSSSAPMELSLWKCPPKPRWYAKEAIDGYGTIGVRFFISHLGMDD